MKCIIGLGNPGSRYRFTRHNIGFLTAEFLIETLKAESFEGNSLYESYRTVVSNGDVLIVMPQTYMNNSGFAVRELCQKYSIAFNDLLVVFDDFQIPFGTLRMRPKGSDGGHNGMASVIYHLENEMIPRLRVGVAGNNIPEHHTHEEMAGYVLSPFEKNEEESLNVMLRHTADACSSWIENGITRTMNVFNKNFLRDANAS